MESNEDAVNLATQPTHHNHRVQPILGNHQLVIITRLLQISGNLRHIDELLLWLSHMIAQRMEIDVVQFWAMQPHLTRQGMAELRASACLDLSLPRQVVVNPQVVEVIERLLSERHGMMPQTVNLVFSQQQASLLRRYQLNYWASYFLSSSVLLPPPNNDSEKIALPMTMVISLFLRQPFNPRLLPTIGHIAEQVVPIARNRGLLLSEDQLLLHSTHTIHKPEYESPILTDLIPRRTRLTNTMQASNPFGNVVVIAEKHSRQLYFAIDGTKTVADLLMLTQLSAPEFYAALRLLLKQKHIQLYEVGGHLLDSIQVSKIL